jgi:hypothetical protein
MPVIMAAMTVAMVVIMAVTVVVVIMVVVVMPIMIVMVAHALPLSAVRQPRPVLCRRPRYQTRPHSA